jgi:hypothetical protein
MTTTGTSTFNMDLGEIIEEAYQRAGSEMRSGYDFKSARRSLNIMFQSWANLGISLWLIEQATIPLITGQITYTLPTNIIDVLDAVTRTGTGQNQMDLNITRISESTYLQIPNKNAMGRPIQYWINRKSGATYPITGVATPTINLWPTASAPDNQYTLVYYYLRKVEDVGDAPNTQDVPFRFVPAMVAGLAYYLSPKIPGVDPVRVQMLQASYKEELDLAMREDREKASLMLVPRMYGGRSGA